MVTNLKNVSMENSLRRRRNSQSDIGFGDVGSKVVWAFLRCEMLLGAVQRLKERHHVALVRLARRGKARLVHAVVDEVVRPLVRLLNLLLQVLRVQLDGLVLFAQEVIELSMCQS